ncbi:MAG: hypothetical protein M0Z25_07045 [Nitrospiraceae bacterium]|nr:hypothetical protein [Nitrospiraceae bacterium]
MRQFSKKKLRARALPFFFLLPLWAVFLFPGAPLALADGPAPTVTLKPTGATPSGSRIHLDLRILPAPTRTHPLHLHLYVDGRMVLMTTATRPVTSLSLPPLSPGRHDVTVVEADPLTHRENGEMSGMKMEGGAMDNMEGMDMGEMKPTAKKEAGAQKGYLAHLILVVTGKKP